MISVGNILMGMGRGRFRGNDLDGNENCGAICHGLVRNYHSRSTTAVELPRETSGEEPCKKKDA